MQLAFYKYHGAGNDFILLDAMKAPVPGLTEALVATLCNRHTGIGADGLMVLLPSPSHAFEMLYYNADGRPGSLCGNGSRCAVALANALGIWNKQGTFLAADGPHYAELVRAEGYVSTVLLEMHVPLLPEETSFGLFVDTGSPHVVIELEEGLAEYPVSDEAVAIRHAEAFAPGGTNVNFLEQHGPGTWAIRTYERGVEAETLACGTGVTAAAWVLAHRYGWQDPWEVTLQARGGFLQVRFEGGRLWLMGPAAFVFEGRYNL